MIADSERPRHPSPGLATRLDNGVLSVRMQQHQRCVNPGHPPVCQETCNRITFFTGTVCDSWCTHLEVAVRLSAHLPSKTALSRNVERPLEYMIRYKKGDYWELSYILSCILGGVQHFCLKQFCYISVRPALRNKNILSKQYCMIKYFINY
jgi:hypothetical protein